MTSSEPLGVYNETAIVQLVTEIYHILIHLGHFQEHEIIFPPPEGHDLDLSQLDENSRIDLRVLSLMQKLPVPLPNLQNQFGEQKEFAPGTTSVSYTSAKALAQSRDIDGYWARLEYKGRLKGEKPVPDMGNALPTVLLLAERTDEARELGTALVLDIADNSIREVGDILDQENRPPAEDFEEAIEYSHHYLNWPKRNAITVLEEMRDKYLYGEWMVMPPGILEMRDESFMPELRRLLLEKYRWPHEDFRREEWVREGAELFDRWSTEKYAAIHQRVRDGWSAEAIEQFKSQMDANFFKRDK